MSALKQTQKEIADDFDDIAKALDKEAKTEQLAMSDPRDKADFGAAIVDVKAAFEQLKACFVRMAVVMERAAQRKDAVKAEADDLGF